MMMLGEGYKKKVLVIEDEELTTKFLKSELLVNRCEVVTATDGADGLNKAKTEKPDLIILDVVLPELRGDEIVKELRKDEVLKRIPVIVMSVSPEYRELFPPDSIYAYIDKPFRTDRFMAVVKQVLRQMPQRP